MKSFRKTLLILSVSLTFGLLSCGGKEDSVTLGPSSEAPASWTGENQAAKEAYLHGLSLPLPKRLPQKYLSLLDSAEAPNYYYAGEIGEYEAIGYESQKDDFLSFSLGEHSFWGKGTSNFPFFRLFKKGKEATKGDLDPSNFVKEADVVELYKEGLIGDAEVGKLFLSRLGKLYSQAQSQDHALSEILSSWEVVSTSSGMTISSTYNAKMAGISSPSPPLYHWGCSTNPKEAYSFLATSFSGS